LLRDLPDENSEAAVNDSGYRARPRHLDHRFLESDFHSFARQLRIGKSSLAKLFHAQEKIVIVFRIVVSHGETLNPGHFRYLHGLIETAMSPSPVRP